MMFSHDVLAMKVLHEDRVRRLSTQWSSDRAARPRRVPTNTQNRNDR